jgi:hypothetical protein
MRSVVQRLAHACMRKRIPRWRKGPGLQAMDGSTAGADTNPACSPSHALRSASATAPATAAMDRGGVATGRSACPCLAIAAAALPLA